MRAYWRDANDKAPETCQDIKMHVPMLACSPWPKDTSTSRAMSALHLADLDLRKGEQTFLEPGPRARHPWMGERDAVRWPVAPTSGRINVKR
jgi:hypothetical protein